MVQFTIWLPDELARAMDDAARARNLSRNEWAVRVLSAAVDPEFAARDVELLRGRLGRAGRLAEPVGEAPRTVDESHELARARRAAGAGTPLSDLVAEDRC